MRDIRRFTPLLMSLEAVTEQSSDPCVACLADVNAVQEPVVGTASAPLRGRRSAPVSPNPGAAHVIGASRCVRQAMLVDVVSLPATASLDIGSRALECCSERVSNVKCIALAWRCLHFVIGLEE